MGKETFYFSHDYNSRTDDKVKKLIRMSGMEGYGLFWAIIEDLYNNANALRLDYEGIAYDMRVDVDLVKQVINETDLFVIEDGSFGSMSVQNRLDKRALKSKKARDSALKRWDNKNANAMRTQCDSNAIKESKVKDNKGKESKIKETKEKRVKTLMSEIKDSDVPKSETEYFQISKAFYLLFKKNLTEAGATLVHLEKQTYDEWINTVRLMFEKKEATKETCRDVFEFLQHDDFWKNKIQNPKKLRVKFTQLYTNKKGNEKRNTGKKRATFGGIIESFQSDGYFTK